MDEANDAKVVNLKRGPKFLSIPHFFSLGKIIFIILLSFTFIFARKGTYQQEDISIVMNKLFEYHIEYKQLNEKIVRRILKTYLEQFDSDKIYLLENEAKLFLDISDQKVKEIITRLNQKDYSDFDLYNKIIDKSVERAREYRIGLAKNIHQVISENVDLTIDKSNYSKDIKDLLLRQKDHFLRFYNLQKKRISIDSQEREKKVFDLYNKKMVRIESDYLDEEGQKHYFALHFLKAFSKSLDAHTYFFSEDEARDMRVSLEKNFEGIGVVLSETIDGVVITDLLKNSPAKESNLINAGDIIVEINNQNIQELPFDDVLKAMKKRDNGQIELGLIRKNNSAIFRINLVARPISMEDDRLTYTSEAFSDGIIGRLVLKSFYENSDGVSSEQDIKNAIKNLKEKGNLKGIVLDLRENAGGFLSQAIKVAGIFISNGVVVMSKYFNEEIKYLRTVEGSAYFNGPLVILTSKMSASAAEIVAQALQDYGVAIVVGDERTFGKGSIQYQTVTNENADYYYKVTIGRYYTVSGKSTQINGVIADIIVPSQYSSFELGERFLENALPPDMISNAYKDSLSDLEPKLQKLFQRSYLPALQKVVVYWKKMLPLLKEKSQGRLSKDEVRKLYVDQQEEIKALLKGESKEKKAVHDLQMNEAVNIVKDMILLEAASQRFLDERFANSKKYINEN